MNPKLTLSLGFRGEFSTGWNEAHGRAANYTFTNGVISNQPHIGHSAFTENNAKFLPQPRIGLAWNPRQQKTVDPRGIRHVQRAARRPRLSHGSERAFQSDLQHCFVAGFEPAD